MGFRITTNMMMNSYRYNLQGSTKKLSDARDMVLTQRKFNSYAEDPAAATQEFRLRRDYYDTYSQLNNTKNVYSKYNTAWNNLGGTVEKLSDATARVASIRGNNGGTGEARSALAIVLRETSESVIHALNQKLGDQFIFAGNDGLNVPFEWRTNATGEKELYYRGLNVNDPNNKEKLDELADEQLYIDLGMGLAEKSANNAVNGSYFNSALAGVDFLGYSTDEDGDPQNLALIMRELADVFQAWDEDMDPQGYNPNLAGPTAQGLDSGELEAKAFRLMDKLKAAQEHLTEKWDELDAQSVFLTTNQERLETQLTDTNTQILDISQVDLADAITSFSWQQYCYNAALKIGNQLLSQSLIDYMN